MATITVYIHYIPLLIINEDNESPALSFVVGPCPDLTLSHLFTCNKINVCVVKTLGFILHVCLVSKRCHVNITLHCTPSVPDFGSFRWAGWGKAFCLQNWSKITQILVASHFLSIC